MYVVLFRLYRLFSFPYLDLPNTGLSSSSCTFCCSRWVTFREPLSHLRAIYLCARNELLIHHVFWVQVGFSLHSLEHLIKRNSLGDVIAFAGLIERIIVEVKSYRSAPEHFQRLALELAFLGQVCNQINQLEPMSQGEIAHIQRMRAISMQCLGPLRAFEEKMRKFDSVLGVETWKGGNGNTKSLPQRKLENFRQRLHWSMIEKREVDELRAILASEILAINTLLGAQQWSAHTSKHYSEDQLSEY